MNYEIFYKNKEFIIKTHKLGEMMPSLKKNIKKLYSDIFQKYKNKVQFI